MNKKERNKTPKTLEQLLEESKAKKKAILKILEKITKESREDQTSN